MDYTNSTDFATHGGTGNPMHEANQAFPTVVGDTDLNGLIWELLEAIKDAGITPAGFDADTPSTYTQLRDALRHAQELPAQAIPYPTIATADNRFVVTPALATAGGTVSIAAGTRSTLGQYIAGPDTGRLRAWTSSAYTSADMDIGATYYLRSQITGGQWTPYLQKGSDSDSAPASLIGTPGAGSGGGFDSTVFDILIAKIETFTPSTLPTVNPLANAATLRATLTEPCFGYQSSGQNGASAQFSFNLDWARSPSEVLVVPIQTNTQSPVDTDSAVDVTQSSRLLVSGTFFLDYMSSDLNSMQGLFIS